MDSSQVPSKLKRGPMWEGAANPPASDWIQPSWYTSSQKIFLDEAQWLQVKHKMPCKFSSSWPSIQKVMWLISMALWSPWSRSRGITRVSFSPTNPGSLATAGPHSCLYCRRTQSWVDLYRCLHRCSRSNCIHPTPGLALQDWFLFLLSWCQRCRGSPWEVYSLSSILTKFPALQFPNKDLWVLLLCFNTHPPNMRQPKT